MCSGYGKECEDLRCRCADEVDYFFGVSLGLLILQHSDNLSRTMQRPGMSAAGQAVTAMTLSTMKSIHNDSSFDLFWWKITASADKLDVENPALPRRRKAHRHLDDGSAPSFHVTVEYHYRVIYIEALDLITTCIEDCFNQPSYKTYGKVQALQALLLKAEAAEP